MAELFGALAAALAFFIGTVIGEIMAGFGMLIFYIIGGILGLITIIFANICPTFNLREKIIKQPQKEYDRAINIIEPKWHFEDGLDFEFLFILFNARMREYAKDIFERLAKYHFPHCAAMVGKCYKEGYGCFRNYKKAAFWLQQAVDDDDCKYPKNIWDARENTTMRDPKYTTDARSDLAELYLYGHGVVQDNEKALQLFDESQEQGNKERFFYILHERELANPKVKK